MNSLEIKKAFIIVWFIISFVIFLMLLFPFILPNNTILSIVPTCEWKIKYHKDCSLCGMTTAFILLSEGHIKAALTYNKGCLFLYMLFIINEAVILYYMFLAFALKFTNNRRII